MGHTLIGKNRGKFNGFQYFYFDFILKFDLKNGVTLETWGNITSPSVASGPNKELSSVLNFE